eukprot:TRINITY_DN1419_c0_g4_i1.p1 TRINITY_DN1419_c0_g4~~TRINITY_DN1419_c0_g4_i1.p1  ORF type:complete len:335 (+),score=58.34 TRINITY_DN1419_c0_g4_i1:2-1006(+)
MRDYNYNECCTCQKDFRGLRAAEGKRRRCAGCHSVYYCSAQCQKDDWKTHQTECKDQQRFLKMLAGTPHATMAEVIEDREGMKNIAQYYYAGTYEIHLDDPRRNGVGGKNIGLAFFWVQRVAKRGDPEGMYWLGKMYLNGECVAKDNIEAFKWFKKSAKEGEPSALFKLGDGHRIGDVLPQNSKEAYRYYRMAADLGHTSSIFNVGKCFSTGMGVARSDEREAMKWYRKASELDYPEAMNNYGNRLLRGIGGKQDSVEGMRWMEKAAMMDEPNAQWTVGMCHLPGCPFQHGVVKDEKRAMELIRKSASLGNPEAIRFLAMPKEARMRTIWRARD